MAPNRAISEPLYFVSDATRLFGWLHSSAGDSRASLGLVICKPFGFEAMSAHLSMRALAESAAAVGVPALRFDYAGTGDSEDLPPGADQLEAWLKNVNAAVEELMRRTGVRRVCVLGIRLGALLATVAASRCPRIQSLIAIAPVLSGRRYLRELRTFELASAHTQAGLGLATSQTRSHEEDLAGSGHLEVSGFFLNAKTMAALEEIDLRSLAAPPISDALIIDRQDLPGASAWRDQLSAAGVATQYAVLPGFVEMVMRPPNLTVVPQAMIVAVRDWLAHQGAARMDSHADEIVGVSNAPAFAEAPSLPTGSGDYVADQPVSLRQDPLLFGIMTSPPDGEMRRRGVILLNSGGDHHIGPRRLHVSLAREWAKRGYFVLRMDLSGLGDSAEQPGKSRNELFPAGAIGDVRAAVEYMRSQHGLQDITLAGICSGASHAVRAAMEGVAVNRVLAVNPLVFFWEDGVDVNDIQSWEVVHKPAAYLGRALSMESWRRLLFGDVSIWRVAQIYIHVPLMAMRSLIRNLARAAHIRLKDDLGRELKNLKTRGVRLVFVFSRGDAGMRLLETQSGLSMQQLSERYCIRVIDGADHEFTRTNARAALGQVLSEELYSRRPGVERFAATGSAILSGSGPPAVGVVAAPPKNR